jgi:signal transduction histidine kinase
MLGCVLGISRLCSCCLTLCWTLRARGGIVLLIALDAAIIQVALVHALPRLWSNEARSISMVNDFSRAFLKSFFFLYPLFVFEFLILRVTFGQGLLSVDTLKWLRQWYAWIIIAATLFAHHFLFQRQEGVPSEIPLVQVSVDCATGNWRVCSFAQEMNGVMSTIQCMIISHK